MVYKGLVMEATKDYIIVLTEDINYVRLKRKENIDIGKRIMFIEEDIIKERNKSLKPLIAIAAAIILIITTVIGQFGFDFMGNFQAYAIVSLDINPSLEFQIDEKEIVRRVNSLNKDGKELLDHNMVGMKIEDAIALSLKIALNKNYLSNENNVVLISDVIMNDDAVVSTIIEGKIFKKIEENVELENIDIIYLDSNKEDLEKARKNNLSIGKYEVYKMVSDKNPDVEIKDIKDKKISDIVKENKDLTKGKKVKTFRKEKDEKTVKNNMSNKNDNNNQEINRKDTEKRNKDNKNESSGNEIKNKDKKNKEIKNGNNKGKDKEDKDTRDTNSKNNIKKNEKNGNNSSKENVKDSKDRKVKEKEKNNKNQEKNRNHKESKQDKNKKTSNKNKGK